MSYSAFSQPRPTVEDFGSDSEDWDTEEVTSQLDSDEDVMWVLSESPSLITRNLRECHERKSRERIKIAQEIALDMNVIERTHKSARWWLYHDSGLWEFVFDILLDPSTYDFKDDGFKVSASATSLV